MNRILGSTMWIPAAFSLLVGCNAPGVGDPCTPESIPLGGFVGSEASLETSSVQCRTRVCIVYQLDGIPFGAVGTVRDGGGMRDVSCLTDEDVIANPTICASREDTFDRVYCSCRCDAPPESTARLCECPEGDAPGAPNGFTCIEVIDQPGAAIGLRGDYCLRNGTFDVES